MFTSQNPQLSLDWLSMRCQTDNDGNKSVKVSIKMMSDSPPWTVIHALAGTGPFRGSRGRMASPSDSSCLRDFGSVSRTRYHGVWRGGRSRRGERNQQQEADERRHRHGMAHLLQHRHDRRVLRTKVCLSSALIHCARAFIRCLFIVRCKSFK